MAVATTPAKGMQPGSLFGMPDVTHRTEYKDSNDGLSTTLQKSSTVQTTGIVPFTQTDIVTGWDWYFTITNTFAAGGGTAATSPYFPYNFLGAVNLNYQSQYNAIQWLSGYDGAVFNAIRPMRRPPTATVLDTNLPSMYSAASNLVSAGNYTSATATVLLKYEVPAAIHFDEYFERTLAGQTVGYYTGPGALVSPQFMAGTQRVVIPTIQYNAAIGTVLDSSPYQVTGGTPTFSGTSVWNVKRRGYYQPSRSDGADSPLLHPWQYTQQTVIQSLSGVNSINIPVRFSGQILSLYVRLFDPAASSGKGAVIGLSSLSECDLKYGSGLYYYQDTPAQMQDRFFQQHGFLTTDGLIVWDLAMDTRGNLTNRYAINTLTTSGVTISLTFTGAQSSSAYAVVGYEGLTYVEPVAG